MAAKMGDLSSGRVMVFQECKLPASLRASVFKRFIGGEASTARTNNANITAYYDPSPIWQAHARSMAKCVLKATYSHCLNAMSVQAATQVADGTWTDPDLHFGLLIHTGVLGHCTDGATAIACRLGRDAWRAHGLAPLRQRLADKFYRLHVLRVAFSEYAWRSGVHPPPLVSVEELVDVRQLWEYVFQFREEGRGA